MTLCFAVTMITLRTSSDEVHCSNLHIAKIHAQLMYTKRSVTKPHVELLYTELSVANPHAELLETEVSVTATCWAISC